MDYKMLVKEAEKALEFSYSPYSEFAVGAALLCCDGSIYTGCNVENASYPAGNCAERTAVFNAVSSGKRDFEAIAIVGGKNGQITDYCPPCGICRQVLREFCKDGFKIILFDGKEEKIFTLSDLLPYGFTVKEL